MTRLEDGIKRAVAIVNNMRALKEIVKKGELKVVSVRKGGRGGCDL